MGRILIAERDQQIQEGLTALLQHMGHQVCGCVRTGPDAVKAARDQTPDAVLIAAELEEGYSGIRATTAIADTLHIPVVLTETVSQEAALRAGAVALVPSPIPPEQLERALSSVMLGLRCRLLPPEPVPKLRRQ